MTKSIKKSKKWSYLFSLLNYIPSWRLFYLNIGARNTHISRICTGICRRWRIQWMVPDVTIKPGYTWNRKRSHLFQGPSSHQYTRSHSVSNNYEYMYIYGCMWGGGGVVKIPSSSPFSWNFQRNVNLAQNYACLVPSLLTFLGGHTWSCEPCELNKHMDDKTEPNSDRRKKWNTEQEKSYSSD